MSDQAKTLKLLNEAFHAEARSLFQYLRYAQPRAKSDAAALLMSVCEQEMAIADRLANEISRLGEVPIPGDYPAEWSNLHFVGFDHLLTTLIDYTRTAMETSQQRIDSALCADLKSILEESLSIRQSALEALEAMQPVVTEEKVEDEGDGATE